MSDAFESPPPSNSRGKMGFPVILLIIVTFAFAISDATLWNTGSAAYSPRYLFLLTIIGVFALVFTCLRLKQQATSQAPAHNDVDRRNRQAMIDKVRAIWITGVLNQSLYQEMLRTLNVREALESVERPTDILVQRPGKADEVLPAGRPILAVYDDMDRVLLILGAPGSGKTTALLELLRDLLHRAERDETHPIPVVFPLSTWAEKRQPLTEWLVDELQLRFQLSLQLAQQWMDRNEILPLLDGLDEVEEAERGHCIAAMNAWRQNRGLLPLVLCSRPAEYAATTTPLLLDGVLAIQPLSHGQVEAFFGRGGAALLSLRQALREDATLWEVLDTPLMLHLFALAYAGEPGAALPARGSREERRRQVLAAYVDRMYSHDPSLRCDSRQVVTARLAWLAQQMRRHRQTVFYLEWLQLDWLTKRWQQSAIRVGMGIIVWLIFGLFAVLFAGLPNGLASGLSLGGFFAGLSALFVGLMSTGRPAVMMRMSLQVARSSLGGILMSMLVCGLLFGLGVGLVFGLVFGLGSTLVSGLVFGLVFGLSIGLLFGLEFTGRPADSRRGSWSAVRSRLGSTLASMLVFGLVGTLVFGLVFGLGFGLSSTLVGGLVDGLVFGLVAGLLFGLVSRLVDGLAVEDRINRSVPNEGIYSILRSAGHLGLSMGLVIGLVGTLVSGLYAGPLYSLAEGLSVGLLDGLLYGIIMGGGFCLQHLFLRVMLVRNRVAPWRYIEFLDCATERVLLRKVGGGYMFIHRYLLEYFATLSNEDKS